jgi:hypothetical protein
MLISAQNSLMVKYKSSKIKLEIVFKKTTL